MDTELNVVCAQCSFPAIEFRDEAGEIVEIEYAEGPETEEEAVELGWTDHGVGLFCPKCSVSLLEDMRRDREQFEEPRSEELSSTIDRSVITALCPNVSSDTVNQFVKMFAIERSNTLRIEAGLKTIPFPSLEPKDIGQEFEFLQVLEALAKRRKEGADFIFPTTQQLPDAPGEEEPDTNPRED